MLKDASEKRDWCATSGAPVLLVNDKDFWLKMSNKTQKLLYKDVQSISRVAQQLSVTPSPFLSPSSELAITNPDTKVLNAVWLI